MDKYLNFGQLQRLERSEIDYRVIVLRREFARTVIVAPHGGGIEPGTSEVALSIAADELSVALFEGIKTRRNRDLHITSTNFDEPDSIALVSESEYVITVHGERSDGKVTFIGGADIALGQCIRGSLEDSGFKTNVHKNSNLQGQSLRNICNRGLRGKGVQLELSAGLRRSFLGSQLTKGLEARHSLLDKYSHAVRNGLNIHQAQTSKPPAK